MVRHEKRVSWGGVSSWMGEEMRERVSVLVWYGMVVQVSEVY